MSVESPVRIRRAPPAPRAKAASGSLPWVLGAGALILALGINYWTGRYVDRIGPGLAPARDLLFGYLPIRDFPAIHTWGVLGFVAVLAIGVALHEWRRAPFFLWAYALIVATRAVFTVLTPLGLPAEAPTFEAYPARSVLQFFDFRYTLFFSGHTALPFMGFLLARRGWVRWACLGFSLVLASSVLMSRLHYSIDVGAAFFIAYGVSRLARRSWRALMRLARAR